MSNNNNKNSNQRNNQYFIYFKNKINSKNKQRSQIDNIPLDIVIKSQDKSRIILQGYGQNRVYLDLKDNQIILDNGYQSIDILSSFSLVSSIQIQIDRLCDTDDLAFLLLFDQIISKINLSQSIKLHFIWDINQNDIYMIDIIQKFEKQNITIQSLKFNMTFKYKNIIKLIQHCQPTLKNLSLVFPLCDYFPQNEMTEKEFLESIQQMKQLERLSIDCKGEKSFRFVQECLSQQEIQYFQEQQQNEEGQKNNQEEKDKQRHILKLKQFHFNLDCIDFMPEYIQLLNFLPQILKADPYIKFRIKFPYELDFHTVENAQKINELLITYKQLFENCTKIISFHFSTAGNKNYFDEKNQKNKEKQEIVISSSQKIISQSPSQQLISTQSGRRTKSILKKGSSIIRSGIPTIETLNNLNFLKKQKELSKLTLKFDQQIDLNDLSSILLSNSMNLKILNIRVRNNTYNKDELNKFAGNINAVIQLSKLCLDIQFVEHILFQIKPSNLTKLVHYKQGRMVKTCTDYTVNIIFKNDPVKLLSFYNSFKFLTTFQGQFPGFEYCQDYYRYYLYPESYDYCVNVSRMCQKIFQQKLFYRKMIARIILALQALLLTNAQIKELFKMFYTF